MVWGDKPKREPPELGREWVEDLVDQTELHRLRVGKPKERLRHQTEVEQRLPLSDALEGVTRGLGAQALQRICWSWVDGEVFHPDYAF